MTFLSRLSGQSLREGKEPFSHSDEAWCKAAFPPHRDIFFRCPLDASLWEMFQAPSTKRGVKGRTQETLKRWLGSTSGSPSRGAGGVRGAWESLQRQMPPDLVLVYDDDDG